MEAPCRDARVQVPPTLGLDLQNAYLGKGREHLTYT